VSADSIVLNLLLAALQSFTLVATCVLGSLPLVQLLRTLEFVLGGAVCVLPSSQYL
jgi:hypothetical protein